MPRYSRLTGSASPHYFADTIFGTQGLLRIRISPLQFAVNHVAEFKKMELRSGFREIASRRRFQSHAIRPLFSPQRSRNSASARVDGPGNVRVASASLPSLPGCTGTAIQKPPIIGGAIGDGAIQVPHHLRGIASADSISTIGDVPVPEWSRVSVRVEAR